MNLIYWYHIPLIVFIVMWVLEMSLNFVLGEDRTFIYSIIVYILSIVIMIFYAVAGVIWLVDHIKF